MLKRATSGRPSTGRGAPGGWEAAIAGRAGAWLVRYSGWFIASVLLATGLLALPIFLMAPTEQASQDPGGPIFDLQEKVQAKFPPRIHGTGFIVEDRTGDILRQAPLWELYQNEERLRESSLERFLYDGYDADNQRQIIGVFTIADAVNTMLALDRRTGATLATATDDQVKQAVHRLFASDTGRPLRDSLSRDAGFETKMVDGQEFNYWRASALSSFVASDNQLLGGGPSVLNLANDEVTLAKERYNRQVQETLRGDQANYRLWGLVIDLNLESREQGRTAVPFVAATVLLVLAVVGISLRSPRSAGLAMVGLLMLFVWLKGGSNLVGLKSSLTLDLIVPIAMISLGVDFFIHAMARYREERSRKPPPAPTLALQNGASRVIGALTLAMLSDGIAFLANVTSGIETVIGFGIAAGIAVFASYIVMGMFLPLVAMRWDQRTARKVPGNAVPKLLVGTARTSPVADGLAAIVMALVRFRWAVLFVAAGLTVITSYLAFQLEPRLDVKEFFSSDSDLVAGLDKLDQHVGPALSGEPAVIYIQGDLTEAQSLSAISELLDRMGDNPNLGQTGDGGVSLYRRTLLTVLGRATGSEYARSRISEETGVAITDYDGDGIPDSPKQILATYDYIVENGVPGRRGRGALVYDPVQVRETLFHDPGSDSGPSAGRANEQATIIIFGVLGTRQQANVSPALESLEMDLEHLRKLPSISFAGVTGSPFTRHSTLQAATSALNTSLPVAVAACLILLMVWMGSVRYAVVTIVPIGLVVSWLYAFMYLAGFHLNFVTATIAAVSIGVGIDYSIHVTQRFRQEMADRKDPKVALRATARGTGVALAGSAASSVIGFAVLAFAPMPLFSAYGIITAAMIAMAAGAALVVLPSLLYLVSGGGPCSEDEVRA